MQAFFIISGFYMSLVLSDRYTEARLFYTNRIARLWPAYIAMLGVGAFALFGLDASATAQRATVMGFRAPITIFVAVFENIFVVGQELLYWFKLNGSQLLMLDTSGAQPSPSVTVGWQLLLVPQSWSLSLEVIFYALAPWLCRQRTQVLILILASSVAFRFAGHLLPVDYPTWQGRLFPCVLFLFLLGILAHRHLGVAESARPATRWGLTVALVALLVAQPLMKLPDEIGRWSIYLAVAIVTPFAFVLSRNSKSDRALGELSYPLYLCHLAVIGVVLTYNPPFATTIALGASLFIALILFVAIDRPIDKWRQKRVRQSSSASARPAPTDISLAV